MTDPVKSSRRQRNAAATRSRVLNAAETLFVSDGYANTTIAGIAERADVAVQTVYAVFGNKRTVLTELLAARVVGEDSGPELRDRSDWREIEQEANPHRQLALLARVATRIGDRLSGLYGALAGAAGSDPEIALLYQEQQQRRWDDQYRVARSLEQRGALRPDLTAQRATDLLWVLASPNTHRALVADRGWSTPDYEQLLVHLLTCALLDDVRDLGDGADGDETR